MPDEQTELFIAIGRIEEGLRFVRESNDRIERKVDAQDIEIRNLNVEVAELKTQRNSNKAALALIVSIVAVIASIANVLLGG